MRLFLLFIFLIPYVSFAAISITEIMYDPEGNDTGREWIEVYNDGNESVDISDWRLEEAETNHKLNAFLGEGTISSGGYAVIADNAETFMADWPSFSGTLFDSSFSLRQQNQIGETLSLKDADLSVVDTVSYDPTIGGVNDGNSLQLISDNWQAFSPTPGAPDGGAETQQETSQSSSSQTSSVGNNEWVIDENEIFIVAIAPEIAIAAGAPAEFRAQAYGFSKNPLEQAEYAWTFGDGAYEHGQSLFHTYRHPGTYVVFVSAQAGKYSATERFTITVGKADIIISNVEIGEGGFVEITNKAKTEIDLSGWIISAGNDTRILPKMTVILPSASVKFSAKTFGFSIDSPHNLSLHYPGGFFAALYDSQSHARQDIPAEINTTFSEPQPLSIVPYTKDISEKKTYNAKEELSATSSVAGVLYSSSVDDMENSQATLPILIGVLAISFIGIAGVVYARGFREDLQNEASLSLDDFEIIDYDKKT